ncbi:MAG: hypothetical protein ACYTF6_14215, partial [Planctomycetota bacterium]
MDRSLASEQWTGAPEAAPQEPQRSVVASMCGVCPAGCGAEVHLADGRIERLAPLRGHPLGMVCPRGARAAEIVYAEDR